MPTTQVDVDVNRDGDRSLSVDGTDVTVGSSFDLVIRGHRTPAHVHCRLDETLASVATLEEPNPYVEADETTVVPVTVEDVGETVTGSLTVTTGYGEETCTIAVTVEPNPSPVAVDESLGEPAPANGGLPVDGSTLTVGVVALVVVAVAALMATRIGGTVGVISFVIVVAAVVTGAVVSVLPSGGSR